ncbi:MAG: dihydropteroate synthase [Rhizobiales bacterium]|nr:dihydropteroate synthase [Hyphomicrobiales bacterium]
MRRYLRPLELSWGADARRAIAAERAGRLGGSEAIAFAAAERIARDGDRIDRDVVAYRDLRDDPLLPAIERPRPLAYRFAPPAVMGIVNVTPDSFSDGGLYATSGNAIAHGVQLAREGAAILDIGGESTRPGSDGVTEEEEVARVIPVVEALAGAGHTVSIDTRKASVMRKAARAGAQIINDVSALGHDPQSLAIAAELGLPVVLMHARGDPKTMQRDPVYADAALDVYDWLAARIVACEKAGIPRDRLFIDPGIGFGKTLEHNLAILQQTTLFHGLGVCLMIGLSRKSFMTRLTGEKIAARRVSGSLGGAVHAALHGAHMIRVHDVEATRQALAVVKGMIDPDSMVNGP